MNVMDRDAGLVGKFARDLARDGLRCPNCNRKFGDRLEGRYETMCPRCRRWITLVYQNGKQVSAVAS